MERDCPVADRLMDAALTLADTQGWAALRMGQIAHEAGVPLAEVRPHFRCKADLLAAILTRIDREVLEQGETSADEPVRERLFDVLMRRFDVVQPHRGAVARILRDLSRDPLLTLPLLPHFALSMVWMLEAAGVSTSGPLGLARIQGLALIHLTILRVWVNDDSPDLGRTMVALDKALKRTEALINRFSIFGGDRGAPSPASGQAVVR